MFLENQTYIFLKKKKLIRKKTWFAYKHTYMARRHLEFLPSIFLVVQSANYLEQDTTIGFPKYLATY